MARILGRRTVRGLNVDRPSRLAFIDTETTGLGPLSRPWEVAVIIRETDYVEMHEMAVPEPTQIPGETRREEWLFQVDYNWDTLPPGTEKEALVVNRWAERGLGEAGAQYRAGLIDQDVLTAAGPEWSIAASVHRKLVGCTLVGVGVHYDAEVLGRWFLRHGLPWQPWHYAVLDLKTAGWGYLRGRDRDQVLPDDGSWDTIPISSERVGNFFTHLPADDERHTALGDARWAERWYDAL